MSLYTITNGLTADDGVILEGNSFNFKFEYSYLGVGNAKVNVVSMPSWITFDETTNTFHGEPSKDEIGLQKLELTLSDGLGNNYNYSASILVNNRLENIISNIPNNDKLANRNSMSFLRSIGGK